MSPQQIIPSASDLSGFDTFISDKSYVNATPEATLDDMKKLAEFGARIPDMMKYPHAFRWYRHVMAVKERQPMKWGTIGNMSNTVGGGQKGAGKDQNQQKKNSTNTNMKDNSNKTQQQQQSVPGTGKAAGGGNVDAANISKLLQNPVKGKVVTRFPPEPSGYMHVGHAKAAMLNFRCASEFNGKMILRFDDTNPSKEKQEFQDNIMEDATTLGVKYNKVTHTSDYFDQLQSMMEAMIYSGVAYVDDTDAEQMKKERFDGIESKCRKNSIETNIEMWKEMLEGSKKGLTCCVRALMDMKDKNKCLRDPTMYRCNTEVPHHRTGNKYKAYPMYDLACPLVDSWEGCTHPMRTTEYKDRAPQYAWVQNTCKKICEDNKNGVYDKQKHPYSKEIKNAVAKTLPVELLSSLTEFGKTNFTHTVLSKRVLTRIVDQGIVDGWTDPRMPTVKGILRRGMTVEALYEFMVTQGGSKRDVLMEWDKIWSFNAKTIDSYATRYAAIKSQNKVLLDLTDTSSSNFPFINPKTKKAEPYVGLTKRHPKDLGLGDKSIWYSPKILLDQADASLIEDGEEVTLIHWGNVICEKVVKGKDGIVTEIKGKCNLKGDVKKTKKKLHWVPITGHETTLTMREYDQLITKAKIEEDDNPLDFINKDSKFDTTIIGESGLKNLSKGDIIQLERIGFFIVDKNDRWLNTKNKSSSSASGDSDEDAKNLILIKIPDGKAKAMTANIVGKVDAAKLQGSNNKGGKTEKGTTGTGGSGTGTSTGSGTVTLSEDRPPGVPDPNANPNDLKALEVATALVQKLKADGKAGSEEFEKALNCMKELKTKCGIREPTKAERKKMEKEAKEKGKK